MLDRRTLLAGAAGAGFVALAGCSRDGRPAPTPTRDPAASAEPEEVSLSIEGTIATGLNVPWSIAFLSTGAAIVSQRDAGSLVRIEPDGTTVDLGRVAGVDAGPGRGEGGLLGIALDPDDDGTLYIHHSTTGDNRVVRVSLDGDRISGPDPILTGIPRASNHAGGRLLFDSDGFLLVATGDANQRELAQDRESLAGKILRIDTEGRPAAGNPFDNRTYSYGHRNIEGLAFDADGRLWATEFGENAADELNLIEAGGNYGWPQVEGTGGEGDLVDPQVTWATEDCSPAGVAIARSTAFVAALRGRCLWEVPLDGDTAGEPKAWFKEELGRIRNVTVAPDDSLWICTSNTDGRGSPGDEDDRILRVTL